MKEDDLCIQEVYESRKFGNKKLCWGYKIGFIWLYPDESFARCNNKQIIAMYQ